MSMIKTAICKYDEDKRQMRSLSWSNPHKDYFYFTDIDLNVGDKVVVDSPYGGLTVVTVHGVKEADSAHNLKWIVDKIDTSRAEERRLTAWALKQLADEIRQRETTLRDQLVRDLVARDPVMNQLRSQEEELKKRLGICSTNAF